MRGGQQRWSGVGGFHGGGLALKDELGVHVRHEMLGGEEHGDVAARVHDDVRVRAEATSCLTSGGVSCAMTVTRLALRPREHAETLDNVDDRVHAEGALRPRLVPLRVYEGGVHAPVQELLIEQDAGDLNCKGFPSPKHGVDECLSVHNAIG